MAFFEKVLQLDRELFFIINGKLTNPIFDLTLPYARNSTTWIPFYLFLLIFITLRHKKEGWFWVLLAVATAASTDLLNSRLIKEIYFRVRPCRDISLHHAVNFLVHYCPQSSSFTSSHAANHFGFAAFIYFTLKGYYGNWICLIFLWAAIICYAQIYVGVHYPLDILGGAIVGCIIGYIFSKMYKKYVRLKKTN